MSTIEILSVRQFGLDSENLTGFCVDLPVSGSKFNVYDFACSGWVLSRRSRCHGIELVANDGPVRRLPIMTSRPDVLRKYPGAAANDVIGFWSPVSVLGMTEVFELRVDAVLDAQLRVPLGQIRGRRQPLPKNSESHIRPLMLTSMGRTGTTWIMHLLAQHPSIVAYRQYPYEMRAGRYWMQVLGAIIEPAVPAQASSKLGDLDAHWWVAHHPFSKALPTTDPRLREWFGRRFVEQLAPMCQRSIDSCYSEVAAIQGQRAPVYFAEKHLPDEIPGVLWEVYPDSKEIFLVRDFRDMLCSIRAFNEKRGSLAFGRNNAGSEREYIGNLGREAGRLLLGWQNRSARAFLLQYEDLVFEPVKTLRNILEYLGLEAAPSRIDEMIRKASVVSAELEHHRTTSEPRRSVGRWRTDLDAASVRACDEVFGSILEGFGYGSDGSRKGVR